MRKTRNRFVCVRYCRTRTWWDYPLWEPCKDRKETLCPRKLIFVVAIYTLWLCKSVCHLLIYYKLLFFYCRVIATVKQKWHFQQTIEKQNLFPIWVVFIIVCRVYCDSAFGMNLASSHVFAVAVFNLLSESFSSGLEKTFIKFTIHCTFIPLVDRIWRIHFYF